MEQDNAGGSVEAPTAQADLRLYRPGHEYRHGLSCGLCGLLGGFEGIGG